MDEQEWFGLPPGEPVKGKTYRADGWIYKDLPRMAPRYFDELVALIGDENIVWLTLADYGSTKRGQMLISPAGMENIRNRAKDITQ